MKKRAIQICITVALSFGVYRLLGWWALAIWATLLIVWATTARSRRQGTWRAAQASMTAEDFMQQIEEQVNRADELVNSRQYDDARLIYERVTEVVRALRESQLHTVPGQTISLSHRVMVANRTLAVPLDRLGELHLSLGNRSAASRYFQEVVELMEEAVPHAGGETRAEFESLVATAKDKVAELSRQIAGKEDQPAEAVFKNIKILTGVPAGNLLKIMQMGYSRSLGTSCAHCHVPGQWEKDDKKPKQITRDMTKMAHTITFDLLRNIDGIKDRDPIVNCTTCHRGQLKPALNLDSTG